MPHEIRVFRTGAVHHVSTRCYRHELRLTPGPLVNLMVESTLIRAAARCGVQIIVATVMGNHVELVVMTPSDNLDDFMEEFLKELSHRLNRMRGTRHTNFPRRYKSTELGDEETLITRIVHILCNPVRARLVSSVDAWPGFSTIAAHRTGEVTLRSRLPSRREAGELAQREWSPELTAEMDQVETTLARPPIWPELDDAAVHARICARVDAEQARLCEEIKKQNGRVMGRRRIEKEQWDMRPDDVRWRPRRRYAAADPESEDAYDAFYEATRRQYRHAAKRWRRLGTWGEYPPGTFPPGWLRCLPSSSAVGPPLPWVRRRPTGT